MVRPTIFVDVDETLVKTKVLYFETDEAPEGSVALSVSNPRKPGEIVRAATLARPSARAFLQAARELGELAVLTSGHSVFQAAVLESLGLLEFVGTVWGSDNIPGQGYSRCLETVPASWVLVDDLDVFVSGVETKMSWLGHNSCRLKERTASTDLRDCGPRWNALMERHYIQCKGWFGGADNSPLTDLVPLVARKLALQTLLSS